MTVPASRDRRRTADTAKYRKRAPSWAVAGQWPSRGVIEAMVVRIQRRQGQGADPSARCSIVGNTARARRVTRSARVGLCRGKPSGQASAPAGWQRRGFSRRSGASSPGRRGAKRRAGSGNRGRTARPRGGSAASRRRGPQGERARGRGPGWRDRPAARPGRRPRSGGSVAGRAAVRRGGEAPTARRGNGRVRPEGRGPKPAERRPARRRAGRWGRRCGGAATLGRERR